MHPLGYSTLCRAGVHDLYALHDLAETATRALCAADYTTAQIETALRFGLGVDARLLRDRTYFVIENRGHLIAAGGWSFRAAVMGNTHPDYEGHPHDVLDPAAHPARLRGFFVHPDFARRGLARKLLGVCQREAAAAGFTRLELLATPTARPLYRACGFEELERITNVFPNGVAAPAYRMAKTLDVGAGAMGAGYRSGRVMPAPPSLN